VTKRRYISLKKAIHCIDKRSRAVRRIHVQTGSIMVMIELCAELLPFKDLSRFRHCSVDFMTEWHISVKFERFRKTFFSVNLKLFYTKHIDLILILLY